MRTEKQRLYLNTEIEQIKKDGTTVPGLAVILVGNNPASAVYVRNKHKACLEV